MRFYTDEKLSEKQSLTPEGFLLCQDTPIARTGTMLYGPGETPIQDHDGMVHVHRDEEEVFRPEFIDSFSGKPVVDEHPTTDVNPGNWKDLARGVVLNPRRGTMLQSDLLVADLLITDQNTISLVRSGKRELSCGYDADYEPLESPGHARQRNMIGNHVALVESGRCGPRCAIGDRSTITQGDLLMFTKDEAAGGGKAKKWWGDLISKVVGAVPEAQREDVKKILDAQAPSGLTNDAGEPDGDEGEQHTHIHIHPSETADEGGKEKEDKEVKDKVMALDAKFDKLSTSVDRITRHLGLDSSSGDEAIEGKLEEEAPPGTGDKARKARDSTYMVDSFQETVAMAEVLVPGIQVPTFDRSAAPLVTFDAMCKLRRTSLDLAYHQPEGRQIIDQIHGKPLDVAAMDCGAVRTLFKATAVAKKNQNNMSHSGGRTMDVTEIRTAAGMGVKGNIRTPADLNRLNAARYAPK